MKKILLICAISLLSIGCYAQQEKELLTNQSIIDMIGMEFGPEVIISKIEASECQFDVSLDALKNLKSQGTPSSVIAEMIKASKTEEVEKTGIFIIQPDGTELLIRPTAFSGTKTRTLASAFTYGIASGKIKSVLDNAAAPNIINSDQPQFTFYFQPFRDNQHLASDWWFRATTSPKEFVLVSLKVNKGKQIREIETGKANLWVGTDMGVKEGASVECDIQDLGDGKFKVTPKISLPVGEYCFFYKGTIPQGGFTNQSVFDFSIQ